MSAELDDLDRRCAELIMGWHEAPNKDGWWDSDNEMCAPLWQPTRNIAQAWECLEKISVPYEICKLTTEEISCSLISEMPGKSIHARAETAPLAITKACLKAKGIEI